MEAIYAVLAIWLWQTPLEKIGFWGGWLLLAYFGVVVVIDIEYRLILHPVSLVGVVIAVGLGWILNGLPSTLIGGAVGFGVMWLLRRRKKARPVAPVAAIRPNRTMSFWIRAMLVVSFMRLLVGGASAPIAVARARA